MKTLAKTIVKFVLVCYFGTACGFPAPGPPPGLNTIYNEIEYFAESSAMAQIRSAFGYYQQQVNLAFGNADALAFTWRMNTENMTTSYWPDLDDPLFAQQNRQTYADFARYHRNNTPATSPLGVFFIGGPAIFNSACTDPHVLGVSSSTLNSPSADALDRWSFFFIDRIERLYNFNCFADPNNNGFSYQKDNIYAHILTHELGHQRGGLTHPNDPSNPNYQTLYHKGDIPSATSGRVDVMWANANNPDLRYTSAIFDQYSWGPFCSSETCANNLHCWRASL